MTVYVLADDLTGANDTAVQFAMRGMRAATILGPDSEQAFSSFAALAYATESRDVTGEEAYRRLRALLVKVAADPDDLVYKKVDSALRGNLGAEIRAVLDGFSAARAALLAPALPANGRTTVGGRQLLGGVPVHETEMAEDPLTPVRESHLPTLLSRQGLTDLGYLPLAAVDGGLGTAQDCLRKLLAGGSRVVVADAVTDGHLAVLARVLSAETGIVPCGTAGLAAALAGVMADRAGAARCPSSEPTLAGPFLAVVGSRSRVAVEQVEAAVRTCHGLRRLAVDPAELSLGPRRKAAVRQAIAEILPHLSAGGAAVLAVRRGSSPGAVPDPASITDGLGEIAGGLAKAVKLRTLFLTGGDTVAGVCRRLAARALAIEGELAPGIIEARVITKAGSFGDELSLVRVVERVAICHHDEQV